MSSHVPEKGEQMVRYYGYYSNVCRGRRKKQNQDALIPDILERDEDSQAYQKNWAKLIQKIYEVDQSTLTRHSVPEPPHGRRGKPRRSWCFKSTWF